MMESSVHSIGHSIEIVVTGEPDNECPICLEPNPSYSPPVCLKHNTFCKTCLIEYASLQISENILPLSCPGNDCQIIIKDSDIAKCTDAPLFAKFQKFTQLQADPTLRECSKCETLNHRSVIGSAKDVAVETVAAVAAAAADDDATKNNNIICSCGHTYCHLHGDLHPSSTCLEYEMLRDPEEKYNEELSMSAIKKDSKPCPNCAIPIFKNAGCDHIVCSSCQKDFCYKCGTDEYLQGTAFRTCSHCGGNYFDHRYERRLQCQIIFCFPLLLPLYFIYFALTIFCCTISCGCGCCCECGKSVPHDDDDDNDNDGGDTKKRATCWDLLRCVGLGLCGPMVQCCVFFPILHRCASCFFTRKSWALMGFQS